MKRPTGWILAMLFLLAPALAAEQPRIEVRTQTDRSAIWVGDRFHYRVTVVHDAAVRFVTDNLQKAGLNLQPFEVISLEHRLVPGVAGLRILEMDILLTTYESEPRQLEIPSFHLYYFVDSALVSAQSDRPAETLIVPPVPIALRSTLPDDVSSLRETLAPPATPFRRRVARPLAIGLLLVALGLLAPLFFHGKHLQAVQETSRRRKQAQQQFKSLVREFAARSLDSESQMVGFYEDLNRSVREYLSAVSVKPTEGKTARELVAVFSSEAVVPDGFSAESLREIVGILQICEQVRYAPNGSALGTQQYGTVVERLRALAAGP